MSDDRDGLADEDRASPEDRDSAPEDRDSTAGDRTPADEDRTSTADGLTHTTDEGDVQMVDVGAKPDSDRRAVATGEIHLRPTTVEAIADDDVAKGDVLATARIGAIQAVKHTWETIPMCHQIPITNVDAEFSLEDDRVELEVGVETTGKTGCEMEAVQGVTTGLSVVWDMVKAVEKDAEGQYPATRIENVRVVEKRKDSTVDGE